MSGSSPIFLWFLFGFLKRRCPRKRNRGLFAFSGHAACRQRLQLGEGAAQCALLCGGASGPAGGSVFHSGPRVLWFPSSYLGDKK